jgi:hypothetical protein
MGRATGDGWYTQRARFYWGRAGREHPGLAAAVQHAWSDIYAASAVLLAADTGGAEYSGYLWRFAETHLQGSWPVSFTAAGLSYRHQWGSLRVATGAATVVAAFGALLAPTDPVTARKYACFARGQIRCGKCAEETRGRDGAGTPDHATGRLDPLSSHAALSPTLPITPIISTHARRYALGDTGRSFVVGYGASPPVRPHHRAASCPPFQPGTAGQNKPHCGFEAFNNPGGNPSTLAGALVGGPNAADAYGDARNDYVRNEVALDYEAAFIGALAATVSASERLAGETWGACLASFPGALRPIKRVV